MSHEWKKMGVLHTEAIRGLTSFRNSFVQKADIHRPAYDTIRTSKVRMYLSRIDQPLRKCNNNKGSIKLKNYSRAILDLAQVWVDNYVTEKLFVVDLTDQAGESYIKKSKDFIQFPCSDHKVIMQSTLDKLGNYLKHNQRFKVDKKKKTIDVSLIPPNVSSCLINGVCK